jgi:hypothetical protein
MFSRFLKKPRNGINFSDFLCGILGYNVQYCSPHPDPLPGGEREDK